MKNNYNKKLFITISSGLLLSLGTNQSIVYAVELEGEGVNPDIVIVESLNSNDDSSLSNINNVFSKENEF